MPEIITSKDNSRLKFARAVRDGRMRDAIFVEGLRLAEEAAANLSILDYFYTSEFAADARGGELIAKLPANTGAEISAKLLESIADTKNPQGIILLTEKPFTGKAVLPVADAAPLFVILHELNNPANVGAILRTAEAASVAGVILTENCADVFAPKSLRAAMGSAFRLPLWTNATFDETMIFCRANKIKTICTALNAEKSHYSIDWKSAATALVIGSEAHGLAPFEIAACDESLKIPMQFPVESLNAAVACGVILYEAQRQKRI